MSQSEFWAVLRTQLANQPREGLSTNRKAARHIQVLAAGDGWEVAVRFNTREEQVEADLTLSGDGARTEFDWLKSECKQRSMELMGQYVHFDAEANPRPKYPRARKPECSIYVRRAAVPDAVEKYVEHANWVLNKAEVLLGWHRTYEVAVTS